ncbi:MAG: CshA/CshB family fibrillar adhesin-related protein [Xanthomarina sp.]
MKHDIKIMVLFAFLFGVSLEGMAQCFPGLPVTGAFADPLTSASPNANRVFWLTWGATYAESQTEAYKYGKPGTRLNVGSKSYGSIDLGGGRYMCVEAEIVLLTVSGTSDARKHINSYIPGTYQSTGDGGDFLDILYNRGGSGGTNGNPNNKMASGIINQYDLGRTVNIEIKVKATTDEEPVRLRGMVLADAEALAASGEYIISSGDGNWTVARVQKNIGKGAYEIRKENNISGTKSITFSKGNNKRTGAVAFLEYNNSAYDTKANGYAVKFSAEFKGVGQTAIAFGLLTSGYDFGDAPASYGKPIHLIDDISFGPDGIVPSATAGNPGPTIDVNTSTYTPGELSTDVRRYLGSTPPDADIVDMFSVDAKGDDNSGTAGADEEDAWPVMYRQFADKEYYKPGDKITATIPYKKGKVGDKISGWIDFDLNGTFDAGERVTATIPNAGDGNVILEWTVPTTRVAYSTYVRLRYFGSIDDETRATGTALHGEVEDHRIYILTPGVTNPTLPSKSKN